MNIIKKITLSLLVTAVASVTAFSYTHAAPVVGFEAGRIIDDIVFTYSQSMNVTQIQNFLNSKMPVCDTNHAGFYGSSGTWYGPPFICLKDYTENGLNAAQIIYNAAQTYSINPQVLLVLLQKEQSLITDTWPASYQYKTATGYGCPDTAPCNQLYYGLTNQIDNAANMFRKILDSSPNWYTPYILGNNYIQYSPNAGCGGTTVNIQNRSTQALYNYTPYQPNATALNAGYGYGDSCSAYGNRNFYLFFTDWFGSTKRRLITTPGEGVYVVENNEKRPFPNEATFLSYSYKWADVTTISNAEFNFIPSGAPIQYNVHYWDGHLVTSPSGGMYVVENGLKRPFPNEGAFFSYSYKFSDALVISSAELSLIPDGVAMPFNAHLRDGRLVSSPSGGMYVVENGLKRPFANEEAFLSYSYKWSDVFNISSSELSLIPDGAVMPYNVHFRDGRLVTTPSTGVYLIENGQKRPFPSAEIFLSYSYKWSNVVTVSSAELSLIPDGTVVEYNTHFREGRLVSTPSGGVFLVDNGLKRPFPSAAIFLSHSYKWSDVLTITPAELSLIPDGTAMQ